MMLHHYFENPTRNISSSSSAWQDSLTAAYECDINKSGTCSVAFTNDGLGGSSMSAAEINDALREYCSSFDQTRLLRRRLILAEGADNNLNLRPRTKTGQEERKTGHFPV